jgi:hypothetical protein|tara:strand:- start:2409 stop:2684 length:276 start_codon:yes stop_codon:yes gene_type:complete
MSKSSYSDFTWCIKNDFQVYIKPLRNKGECKIAIRKGGISTDGKPSKYCKEKGVTLYSTETLGEITYSTQKKAMDKLPEVYAYLRNRYGNV